MAGILGFSAAALTALSLFQGAWNFFKETQLGKELADVFHIPFWGSVGLFSILASCSGLILLVIILGELWSKKTFDIRALALDPDTSNLDQLGFVKYKPERPIFVGDLRLAVHNLEAHQGIGGFHFRICGIDPPFGGSKPHHPSTQDSKLRLLRFHLEDAAKPDELSPGAISEIRVLKAKRQPINGSLSVNIYGDETEWIPEASHILTVEALGSGAARREERFRLIFSSNQSQPVLKVKRLSRFS